MPKQSLLRSGFMAALLAVSFAGSSASSYAATSGPSGPSSNGRGGSSGPSGNSGPSNPGGGGGGTSPAARLIIVNTGDGCRTHRCTPPPVRRIPVRIKVNAEQPRCSTQWRNVMLDDGSIVEDRSQPMRRNCRIIKYFD